VIEGKAFHASVLIIPENQSRYRSSGFVSRMAYTDKDNAYSTFGAGPVPSLGGPLSRPQAGILRDRDADLDLLTECLPIDLQGRDEDDVIDALFTAFQSYAERFPLDYDLGAGRLSGKETSELGGIAGLAARELTDGYNSNSFARGLLEAIGLEAPQPSVSVPGFDRPVPPEYFTPRR